MDDARTPEELARDLDEGHAEICAASASFLEKVAAFDREKLWKRDGATSMTSWLKARYGLTKAIAREWVRVARALEGLPAIREAYERGRLSFEHLRPLTYLASAETDEAWAQKAPLRSAGSLWREKDRLAKLDAAEEERDRTKRYLGLWRGEDRWVWIEGHLPPEEGAAVEKALSKAAEELAPDPEAVDPAGARLADALFELASEGPGTGGSPTVVVHADAEVLAGVPENGRPHLGETDNGVRLPDEAIRRMACDAQVDWSMESAGRTVGIGRAGRRVPPWMLKHLRFRDRGCRFPGCGRERWLKAHHLVHWGKGGPTDVGNLVLVCHAHHRMVHEGGWGLRGDPEGELRWIRPTGRRLEVGAGLARAGPAP